jgi:hypothetical protein
MEAMERKTELLEATTAHGGTVHAPACVITVPPCAAATSIDGLIFKLTKHVILSLFFMNYNCILTNSIIITFNIHI